MSRKLTKEISWLLLAAALLTIIPLPMADALTIKTSRKLVVLDPGHGGVDSGIISTTGIHEKQITLNLARMTAQRLSDQYYPLLCRTTDIRLSETERAAFANQNMADLFLSLHLHSENNRGFFFYFDTPDTAATSPGFDWRTQALNHQDKSKQAATLFATIFQDLGKKTKPFSGPAPALPLEGLRMTALLLEPFSISDIPGTADEQERFLASYAEMIARSIEAYFEKEAL